MYRDGQNSNLPAKECNIAALSILQYYTLRHDFAKLEFCSCLCMYKKEVAQWIYGID